MKKFSFTMPWFLPFFEHCPQPECPAVELQVTTLADGGDFTVSVEAALLVNGSISFIHLWKRSKLGNSNSN